MELANLWLRVGSPHMIPRLSRSFAELRIFSRIMTLPLSPLRRSPEFIHFICSAIARCRRRFLHRPIEFESFPLGDPTRRVIELAGLGKDPTEY